MELKQEILTRIDALAAKLGVTADHIWLVLVKQAGVEAWMCGAIGVTCAILAVVAFSWCWKLGGQCHSIRESERHYGSGEGFLAGAFFSGLAGVALTIATMVLLSGVPTLVMNPEYWALKQVLAAVK